MKTLLAVAAMTLVPLLAYTEEAPNLLEPMKTKYEEGVLSIGSETHKDIETLLNRYSEHIRMAIAVLKTKGDPEPVVAATAEQARFEKEKTVPNPPDTNLPEEIQGLQLAHNEAVSDAGVRRDERVVGWSERYVKALDRLMRKHTANDEILLAMKVKNEKRRVEFVLADTLARLEPLRRQKAEQLRKREEEARKVKMVEEERKEKASLLRNATRLNGHRYKAFEEHVSWSEAKEACEKLGGHLVTVNSAKEQQFVEKIAPERFWIGLYKSGGLWGWVTGEPVSYVNWGPNRPDGIAGNTRKGVNYGYAAKGLSYRWNDTIDNSTSVGYICEWE